MKIHFNPKDILPKLKIAKAVAAARDVKPILQNVKIVASKEHGVILHATDTAQGIRIRVKCKVVEDGAALLPIKRLIDILGSTKASHMTLASTDGGVALEWDGEAYTFLIQSPDEFPDVSDFQAESYHEILAWVMQAMIQRTVFAVDKQAERYALAGVCFQSDGVAIDATATDGKQLAWQPSSGENIGEHKIDTAIVPAHTLKLLDKILKDKSVKKFDKVKMAADVNVSDGGQSSGIVLFQCGDFTLFTRLHEGRYPKWRSIIPKTDGTDCAVVNCGALLTAVNNVKSVVTDIEPGIYLTFEKGRLTLVGHGKEVGTTKKAIPLSYNGRTITFKIDEKFLTTVLKVLGDKTQLTIYLPDDKGSPILIRCAEDYHYVVMPMDYKESDMPAECGGIETAVSRRQTATEVEVEDESETEVETDDVGWQEVAAESTDTDARAAENVEPMESEEDEPEYDTEDEDVEWESEEDESEHETEDEDAEWENDAIDDYSGAVQAVSHEDEHCRESEPESIAVQWSEKLPTEEGLYFVYYEVGKIAHTAVARLSHDNNGRLSVSIAGQDTQKLALFLWQKENLRWLAIDEQFLTGILLCLHTGANLSDYFPKPMIQDDSPVDVELVDNAGDISAAVEECRAAGARLPVELPKKLIFHSDGGHGWLAVKRSLLHALGIEKDISSYSYQRGDTVYLEEDGDTDCFFKAMIAVGYTAEQVRAVIEERYQHTSPVRSYESYKPDVQTESKPPTAPAPPQPAPPRPANSGKSAVVQRESGASVNGIILSSKQRGYIVFEEQESGKLYRIPTHGCKKQKSGGVTYVSISETHLSANLHLLDMFMAQSLF